MPRLLPLPAAGLPQRWSDQLRRSLARGTGALTALALLTGVGAGAGAVAFRYLILGFTYLFTGHRDYSAVGHAANPLLPCCCSSCRRSTASVARCGSVVAGVGGVGESPDQAYESTAARTRAALTSADRVGMS